LEKYEITLRSFTKLNFTTMKETLNTFEKLASIGFNDHDRRGKKSSHLNSYL
jgi:hypothetical protein